MINGVRTTSRSGMPRCLKAVGLLLLTLIFVQCGEKEEDPVVSKFKVVAIGSSPLIHITDRTIGGRQLSAPWFKISFQFQNTSDERVLIEEILFYVTVDGVEAEPFAYNLGSLDYSDAAGNSYIFEHYCVYPPNATSSVNLAACANGSTSPLAAGSTVITPLSIYVDGIKEPAIESYAFPVRAVLRGLIIDSNGRDSARFEKTISFVTQ